jgi:hypothetical protein
MLPECVDASGHSWVVALIRSGRERERYQRFWVLTLSHLEE